MNTLFKISIILISIIGLNSCAVDLCEDKICGAGTTCIDGHCAVLLDQEVQVNINVITGYLGSGTDYKLLDIILNIDALAKIEASKVTYANLIIDTDFGSTNNNSKIHSQFNELNNTYESYNDFIGNMNIELVYDKIRNVETSFTYNYNIDSLTPPIATLIQNTNDLSISWNSDASEYTNIRIYGAPSNQEKQLVFETKLNNPITSINVSNITSGWIGSNTDFITGYFYKIIIEPTIENNSVDANISYFIKTQSQFENYFTW